MEDFLFCYFSCQFKQENVIRKEITDWQFQHNGESLNATVPGNNFTDLLNHKLISDPFYGTYEDSVQSISDRDWNYRFVPVLIQSPAPPIHPLYQR